MKARLARWVSILFDSSVLSLIVFPAIGWHTARLQGILWALGTLVIITGIPLAYIIVGQKVGWVADWELSRREDRPRFILVSLSSDLLAFLLLYYGHAPRLLQRMVLAYLFLGMTMFTISNFWKISLHMVGVSGFVTALIFVFGPIAAIGYLALPVVAWARLYRRKHTVPQLIAGALGGALITALVFAFPG